MNSRCGSRLNKRSLCSWRITGTTGWKALTWVVPKEQRSGRVVWHPSQPIVGLQREYIMATGGTHGRYPADSNAGLLSFFVTNAKFLALGIHPVHPHSNVTSGSPAQSPTTTRLASAPAFLPPPSPHPPPPQAPPHHPVPFNPNVTSGSLADSPIATLGASATISSTPIPLNTASPSRRSPTPRSPPPHAIPLTTPYPHPHPARFRPIRAHPTSHSPQPTPRSKPPPTPPPTPPTAPP